MTIRSWVILLALPMLTTIPKMVIGGKFWRFGFLYVRPGKHRLNRQASACYRVEAV
jgi:hypothetical protein